MSTFFSRLPARHDVRKYTKAVASHMLDDDSRVVIAIGNLSVASLREYCAALLWLNDNSPILLSDIESLSSNERSTLCTLLGLVETGVQVAVSRRILASLAGHAPPPPPPRSIPCSSRFIRSSTVPRRRFDGLRRTAPLRVNLVTGGRHKKRRHAPMVRARFSTRIRRHQALNPPTRPN